MEIFSDNFPRAATIQLVGKGYIRCRFPRFYSKGPTGEGEGKLQLEAITLRTNAQCSQKNSNLRSVTQSNSLSRASRKGQSVGPFHRHYLWTELDPTDALCQSSLKACPCRISMSRKLVCRALIGQWQSLFLGFDSSDVQRAPCHIAASGQTFGPLDNISVQSYTDPRLTPLDRTLLFSREDLSFHFSC